MKIRKGLGIKPHRRRGREIKSGRRLKLRGDTVSEETGGWGERDESKGTRPLFPQVVSHWVWPN